MIHKARLEAIRLAVGYDEFVVKFRKRKTGEERVMVCKFLPKEKGRKNPVDTDHHNLMTVWDMETGGYKSVPLEGIMEIGINNLTYTFERKRNVSAWQEDERQIHQDSVQQDNTNSG